MLRQVYMYYENDCIYRHIFATAYASEKLADIMENQLKTYIVSPVEGKIFSKPLGDYQIHFGLAKQVFYLFITDQADKPKTIATEVDRAIHLFQKNFPNPVKIKDESPEREEYTNFIQETHYYLHPKIALMGGNGAGKSTIVKLLAMSEEPEKRIMHFADYHRIKIRDLYFDLWDYIENDEYSPLWNKYIGGSDIIIHVIDGTNLSERKENFYFNLFKRESKFSHLIILLTHADAVHFNNDDVFKKKYPEFATYSIYMIDLAASDAKDQLLDILIESIGLKKPLPKDFRTLVVQANELVSKENYEDALKKLNDLVTMCKNYQEFSYLEVFEGKIKEMQEKWTVKKQREDAERLKISKPKEIKFEKFTGPKTLPALGTSENLPPSNPSSSPVSKSTTTPLPLPSENELEMTGSKEVSASQAEILGGIKKTNPFFSGMKSISPSTTPEASSLTPIPTLNPDTQLISEISEKQTPQTLPAGAPINRDMTYILHSELQKVQPINIAEMEGGKPSKSSQLAESVMEKSITLLKGGVSLDKKLSFEKSPLAKDEILPSRSDVQKTGILQPPQIRLNPLEGFSKQKDRMQILLEEEAEKLGEAIRNLGESLSRPLCEKFIEQLRIRYGKTNLSENDIEKAAKIYVDQRHRQRSA